MKVFHVGIGQIAETSEPDDRVEMLGLGSCVGIFLYVPGKYVVAAHALLDESGGRPAIPPGKFVDSAIPHLLHLAGQAGHRKAQLKAGIAGGAQIFAFSGGRPELGIGARNVNAARSALGEAGIPIMFDDTGGSSARRARIIVSEGTLVVESQQKAA